MPADECEKIRSFYILVIKNILECKYYKKFIAVGVINPLGMLDGMRDVKFYKLNMFNFKIRTMFSFPALWKIIHTPSFLAFYKMTLRDFTNDTLCHVIKNG